MAPALTPPPIRAARLQAETQEKSELVGRLAGAVAHDVNNMLTVVVASAEFLAEEATIPEQREAAAQIGEAARHAAALTQQLVVVSKKGLAQPRPVDLCAALQASATALRRLLPAAIALSVDAPGAAWTCIDPTQLHQLVLNLAMNARDAMPEGGALRLSVRSDGGEVTLGVADTGTGMDQATQAAAFQPFFTTKAPGKGTGLGLANVQAIVAGLGGRVALASALGKGTTFEIVMPACEPALVAAPRGAAPAKGSGRVLVVDGDVRIRALASGALLAAGYDVLDAPDGPTGLRLAASQRPDLLVTDAVVPGLPLGVLVEGYGSARPGGRVLVTTAFSDDRRIQEQVRSGALALLPKPYSRAELQAAAAAALAAPTPRPA
jgi:CheY-like chemotaxis protein/anti-sigma regulatory factor (Ser/Thr protein kinase)